MDLSQHETESPVSIYKFNQYFCDICKLRKHVRPYIYRCIPCGFDACPHHFYRGNHAYVKKDGFANLFEIKYVENFEVEDPNWKVYERRAIEDGIDEDHRETEYYGEGINK
jgi:hypothetical protein